MSTKHTPGPWSIHPRSATSVMAEGMGIASCAGHSDNKKDPVALCLEQEANARLIAAAPDMLEALEFSAYVIERLENDLKKFRPGTYSGSNKARAAIAKAKGEA
jgi:hypothetical protein